MTTLNTSDLRVAPLDFPAVLRPTAPEALMADFATLIYERTGIRLSQQKQVVLNRRLSRRLGKQGPVDLKAYFHHVSRLPRHASEWEHFLQHVTCHQTHLFRDEEQWTWFREKFLPARLAATEAGQSSRRLRIWSAAASTGDEAFTTATCVADAIEDLSQWRVEIIGTDLAAGPLEQAQTAMFSESALRYVPEQLRNRYFAKAADTSIWKAKSELASLIEFRQHNLLDRMLGRKFEVIWLKNVLIYFDHASQQQVLRNVLTKLSPGGLLITAPTDGLSESLQSQFDLEAEHGWLFRRK